MVIHKKYVFSKPFATLETRKKLGQVNFRKDFWYCYQGHREICPMESLGNDDGDGYENVTYNVNSRCFKLDRAFSISFSSSNLGNFFWSCILKYCSKVQEKKKKVVVFVHVLHKTRNWVFSRRSRAVMAEKCFKKRDARAELLFC